LVVVLPVHIPLVLLHLLLLEAGDVLRLGGHLMRSYQNYGLPSAKFLRELGTGHGVYLSP